MHDLDATVAVIEEHRDLVTRLSPPVNPSSVPEVSHLCRVHAHMRRDVIERAPGKFAQLFELRAEVVSVVGDTLEEHVGNYTHRGCPGYGFPGGHEDLTDRE